MTMVDRDPFRLLEEALALDKENTAPETPYAVAYLPDGDVHVCMGVRCPHIELNTDKCYVCTVSGIVWGALSIREDFSTGRQAGSSNPDDHAGEPVGGQWKAKKDLQAMSTAAYTAANQLDEEDDGSGWTTPAEKRSTKESPRVVKRGARCVDEPDLEQRTPKRPRGQRRNGTNREQFRALQEDAELTLCKLVNFDKRTDTKALRPSKPRDVRLQDREAIFQAAFKKYTKECIASGAAPTLDAVHNIAIKATNVALEEKRRAAAETAGSKAHLLKVRMREQVTSLAVSLWLASCETPYMESGGRRADSFRPFVCGVLYALKRGVSLTDGTVVVPACEPLASALPALRNTAPNSAAKQLHASSHRGLCTLHRSISSCDKARALELYKNSAQLARQLQANVRAGNFDLC